jgi:hypothetical protein
MGGVYGYLLAATKSRLPWQGRLAM